MSSSSARLQSVHYTTGVEVCGDQGGASVGVDAEAREGTDAAHVGNAIKVLGSGKAGADLVDEHLTEELAVAGWRVDGGMASPEQTWLMSAGCHSWKLHIGELTLNRIRTGRTQFD